MADFGGCVADLRRKVMKRRRDGDGQRESCDLFPPPANILRVPFSDLLQKKKKVKSFPFSLFELWSSPSLFSRRRRKIQFSISLCFITGYVRREDSWLGSYAELCRSDVADSTGVPICLASSVDMSGCIGWTTELARGAR
ncbi:hypothetical protein Dimus_021941 [Dionaea muscipula]